MSWIALASTALGGLLGIAGTLTGEKVKWKRANKESTLQHRRELYVDCLVTMRRAHEAMRLAASENPASQDREGRVLAAFQASGCDEARERLLLTASNAATDAITDAYHKLRTVRDVLAAGHPVGAGGPYDTARQEHGDATRAARAILRQDLASLEQ